MGGGGALDQATGNGVGSGLELILKEGLGPESAADRAYPGWLNLDRLLQVVKY